MTPSDDTAPDTETWVVTVRTVSDGETGIIYECETPTRAARIAEWIHDDDTGTYATVRVVID